jgi:hypothetical protein
MKVVARTSSGLSCYIGRESTSPQFVSQQRIKLSKSAETREYSRDPYFVYFMVSAQFHVTGQGFFRLKVGSSFRRSSLVFIV